MLLSAVYFCYQKNWYLVPGSYQKQLYFNKNFCSIGVTVERSEIKSEYNAVLIKLDKGV
jgi:hypothetical protein